MIDEARRKDYTGPVAFVLADLYNLPFAAHSFEFVTLGFWFSHEPRQDYDRFFAMLKDLVTQGGLIWMIDNNPPAEGPEYRSVGLDEHGNNYRQRFLNSGREFAILKNYFDKSELIDIFSGDFQIESLIYNECYWSLVLRSSQSPCRI
jgi:ubiquinone/menaquinone biosynthesis C-methylase UbiE